VNRHQRVPSTVLRQNQEHVAEAAEIERRVRAYLNPRRPGTRSGRHAVIPVSTIYYQGTTPIYDQLKKERG
jgi:hypothetical protein